MEERDAWSPCNFATTPLLAERSSFISCNFATTHWAACILNYYLLVASIHKTEDPFAYPTVSESSELAWNFRLQSLLRWPHLKHAWNILHANYCKQTIALKTAEGKQKIVFDHCELLCPMNYIAYTIATEGNYCGDTPCGIHPSPNSQVIPLVVPDLTDRTPIARSGTSDLNWADHDQADLLPTPPLRSLAGSGKQKTPWLGFNTSRTQTDIWCNILIALVLSCFCLPQWKKHFRCGI